MRIFQVLSKRMSWGVSHDGGWLRNLYEPLIELGHDVYLFEFSPFLRNNYFGIWKKFDRKAFEAEIIKCFKREHKKKPFDLFFSYLSDEYITPDLPQHISKYGVLTANFSCNNTHQFHLVEKASPFFTFNLHSEKNAVQKFKAIGANPVWFPMAANPKYYKPYPLKKEFDLTFVGQNYATRPYYILHLLENGIDVRVWGTGWREKKDFVFLRKMANSASKLKDLLMLALIRNSIIRYRIASRLAHLELCDYLKKRFKSNFGLPLSDEETIRMFSRSKISLGFVEVWENGQPGGQQKSHIHLREFEGPMSGALYCTGYTEDLPEFYEPDKEVITYRNKEELVDKVKYYLLHDVEADKVRKAGYKRALKSHTCQMRFKELFTKIQLG